MFLLYKRISKISLNGYYKVVKFSLPLYRNFSLNKISESQSITKDKLITLLKESINSRNYKRLSFIINDYSGDIDSILNTSLNIDYNVNNITNEDFLQTFDILIIWRSLQLSNKYKTDIKDIVNKLLNLTVQYLSGFSFIRLALVLHQISQLFSYIDIHSLDILNRELVVYLSHLSHLDIDSHSLCLMFNYIAITPCENHHRELFDSFLSFMDFNSKRLEFTPLDCLFMYKTANKLYQRYNDPRLMNIAIWSINSYINSDSVNLTQLVRLSNQLFSNFGDDLSRHELYKELLDNMLKAIYKHQVDVSCDLNEGVINLIKRINRLIIN